MNLHEQARVAKEAAEAAARDYEKAQKVADKADALCQRRDELRDELAAAEEELEAFLDEHALAPEDVVAPSPEYDHLDLLVFDLAADEMTGPDYSRAWMLQVHGEDIVASKVSTRAFIRQSNTPADVKAQAKKRVYSNVWEKALTELPLGAAVADDPNTRVQGKGSQRDRLVRLMRDDGKDGYEATKIMRPEEFGSKERLEKARENQLTMLNDAKRKENGLLYKDQETYDRLAKDFFVENWKKLKKASDRKERRRKAIAKKRQGPGIYRPKPNLVSVPGGKKTG